MTDTAAGQANAALNGELMDIGTVAAHNIAQAIGVADDKVYVIRDAIRNEISVMGSHFTSAVADVQTHYEAETVKLKADLELTKTNLIAQAQIDVAAFKAKVEADLKADFSFLKTHAVAIGCFVSGIAAVAAAVGHFIAQFV